MRDVESKQRGQVGGLKIEGGTLSQRGGSA